MVVDALAKQPEPPLMTDVTVFTTTIVNQRTPTDIAETSTFMNLSGNAVRYWMQKKTFHWKTCDSVDDLALPLALCA